MISIDVFDDGPSMDCHPASDTKSILDLSVTDASLFLYFT